jgi:cytochrome c
MLSDPHSKFLILPGVVFAALFSVAMPLHAEGDPARGARAFQRCYACHSLDPAEPDLEGPTLNRIVGRRAGARDGYEYSEAMAGAGREGLVWTEAALDAFIADPHALVPGTSMAPMRVIDPGERADLIAYLKRAGR